MRTWMFVCIGIRMAMIWSLVVVVLCSTTPVHRDQFQGPAVFDLFLLARMNHWSAGVAPLGCL